MDKVARLSSEERRDLFRESAALRGMRPAIIEKDFWVCWVLKTIFGDPFLKDRMVFKGGTSLSKVFKLIDRFSEDIDLVLDWRLLGYGSDLAEPDPTKRSNTQLDKINRAINATAATYIGHDLIAKLKEIFATVPAIVPIIDATDPHCINVRYPAAFQEDYVRSEVRLEIGPLASWVPSASYTIQPYASEDFPQVFDDPSCPVTAIRAERTFWEKATILHAQAHRPGLMPSRYSRHYYDLYRLATSRVKDVALADLQLLSDVVAFKQRFYPSSAARYDLAKPGSFRLMPTEKQAAELLKDYRAMAVMIFGDLPPFDLVLQTLASLEREINQNK